MSHSQTSTQADSGSSRHKFWSSPPTLSRSEQAAVYNQMRHNARANADFYVMILLSSSIAFFGLLQNSVAVIIGAMLVAPLMSPMIAIAHSIVMGNLSMFRRAATSTLSGMLGAIAIAAILTFVLPYVKQVPPGDQILGRTHPNILDLYVALASGAAAAYALSRKGVAAALPGVAIAAALVPPLCVVGYGLGSLQWEIANGALLLFLTNLAAIVFASAVTFLLLGFRPTRDERSQNVRRGVAVAITGLAIVTVPLAFATLNAIGQLNAQLTVGRVLEEMLPADYADVDDLSVQPTADGYQVGFTVYRFGESQSTGELNQEVADALYEQLSQDSDDSYTIRARLLDSDLRYVDGADLQSTSD